MDVVGTDAQLEEGFKGKKLQKSKNGGDRRVRGVCLVNVEIAWLMSCVLCFLGLE